MKIVNEIRSRALNPRLKKTLCERMDSQHEHFLHTEVRWLSRGRVLLHFVELKKETKQFSEKGTLHYRNFSRMKCGWLSLRIWRV